MSPVYLHALGVVNALGHGVDAVRAGLARGEDSGMIANHWLVDGTPTYVGAVSVPLPEIPAALSAYASRNIRILMAAVGDIREAIDLAMERYGPNRVGAVLGTSTSGSAEAIDAITARVGTGAFPAGYDYRCQELGAPSAFLRAWLGIRGPTWVISTACTASAKTFPAGRRLLDSGLCDAVIVGGADALNSLTLNGFHALGAIDAGHCQPFSANRRGINIGEGAAIFLMSREPGRVALLGVGETSDAYHISAPDPEGRGAETAMRQALADAGVAPADVDYISLHGTATIQNDRMESHAVARVFGGATPCSSSKPQIGHTLGAAGAMEAALCWLTLTAPGAARLPPNLSDGVIDTELAPLHLVERGEHAACRITLSNSFAFGGSNASVVLGRG